MAMNIQNENEGRIAEEYLSSLSDLNCNSKPLINMLTILAEENIQYAPVIVKVVEEHIAKVQPEYKLPILYLIDSIVKNVKNGYVQLFSQCIVNIFCGVFESVNEKIRERMYALRLTWNEVFSPQKLYALDVKVKRLDNNWPITATKQGQPSIHVNPDFLKNVNTTTTIPSEMEEILQVKTRELLELKKRKLELELEATKKHLAEQEKQLSKTTEGVTPIVGNLHTSGCVSPANSSNFSEFTNHGIVNPHNQVDNLVATCEISSSLFQKNFQSIQQPQDIVTTKVLEPADESFTAAANFKSKIEPVDSKFFHSKRHRDPRLSRRKDKSPGCVQKQSNRKPLNHLISESKTMSLSNRSNNSKFDKSNTSFSESKMSTKHSSYGSSSRSRKNDSKYDNKNREKKGNDDQPSCFTSEERKKISNRDNQNSLRCSKSTSENPPLALKRKSSSPNVSPNKRKDSKRIHKKNEYVHNKYRSRSSSPTIQVSKDVDFRLLTPTTLEKPDKYLKPIAEAEYHQNTSPSKSLDKTFSKPTNTIDDNCNSNKLIHNESQKNFIETIEDSKNSKLALADEEPKNKRNKSVKLETLFGTEDVDLRTVPLQIPIFPKSNSKEITAPPPPVISKVDNSSSLSHNWNFKKHTDDDIQNTSLKSSNLDDVRAKLAKAAKYNKIDNREKLEKDYPQKLKLVDLSINEDSQEEANDEKIRTIISQAQELLQSKSMSSDQYKNLVKTVISINETNKLKAAKRRESFKSNKLINSSHNEEDQNAQRKAAREAILKKRIPKLVKNQIVTSEKKSLDHIGETSNKSPVYDEKSDLLKTRFNKERSNKFSKWSEQRIDSNFGNNFTQQNWQSPSANKRGFGGFRSSVPHPPLPPLMNPNLNISQLQWNLNTNNGNTSYSNQMELIGQRIPPPPQPPHVLNIGVPPNSLISKSCNSINNPQSDLVRTITIDGHNKEIRVYDQVAIVFMDDDQPRDIGFQDGQRNIYIDNMEPITLNFNDDYKPIVIDGESHIIRFGFPSHELYINEAWYEIYFGGAAVSVPIKNKLHVLRAEGPPPQVNIGAIRRDLVVGKINMIVEAHIIIPLFLDATVQIFFLNKDKHTIQFADNLLTLLIDGEPTNVDYGGLPKCFNLGSKKYFIRFSALPKNIIPGKVHMKNMIFVNLDPLQNLKTENYTNEFNDGLVKSEKVLENLNDADECTNTNENFESNNLNSNKNSSSIPMIPTSALNKINIDELFQKLVSSGILSNPTIQNPDNNIENKTLVDQVNTDSNTVKEKINTIELSKTETIKARQAAIVDTLYLGMQCSSCGLRFPPEETIKYSQHLDWHFRRNRRERDLLHKSHSRKWYYEFADWMKYEEIDDAEEREKNFFEQSNQDHLLDDASNSDNWTDPTCAAGPDKIERYCDMCQEKFEQFYNEELEEWHLRCALKVNDKFYHPLCFGDLKVALNMSDDNKEKTKEEQTNGKSSDLVEETNISVKTEKNNSQNSLVIMDEDDDDDDDDVIVLPNEEPSVTEIYDDEDEDDCKNNLSEVPNIKDVKLSHSTETHETAESDIEIHEPHIPFTDLDTYEEKEQQLTDEISTTTVNIKIKEEPIDEHDDDDFEDVGTVLIVSEDEISVNSSKLIQAPDLELNSSFSAEKVSLTGSDSMPELKEQAEIAMDNMNLSMDGNIEPQKENNLSSMGSVQTMPLANLVNKIKINISKNISANSCNTSLTKLSKTDSCFSNINSLGTNSEISHIPVISNIPVLCGGSTVHAHSMGENLSTNSNANDSASNNRLINNSSNVSNISVIGSYENSFSTSQHHSHSNIQSNALQQLAPASNDAISYSMKQTLQNMNLKKTKKIFVGTETSGLCTIM